MPCCGGSVGITAGFTGRDSSGKVVGCSAQAVSRSASSNSTSRHFINDTLTILNRLVA
jgi:hypothetical protein